MHSLTSSVRAVKPCPPPAEPAPLFSATVGAEVVEEAPTLDELLAVLEQIHDPGADVCIWYDNLVIAVRRSEGGTHWLRPVPDPRPAA